MLKVQSRRPCFGVVNEARQAGSDKRERPAPHGLPSAVALGTRPNKYARLCTAG